MASSLGRGRVADRFERDHVQHIYDEIAPRLSSIQHKAWPNVKKFLKLLHPGALVADIGCGNGRYLNINRQVYKVGLDRCCPLVESCRSKGHEVLYGDNLNMPFRDNLFDAVISIGVIHHFSSEERRLRAIQELTRILRPGGKLMIYVWAFEQKHRRFDSQDVLVPWHGGHHGENSKMKRHGSDQSYSSTSSVSEDDDAEEPSFKDSWYHNQQDSTQLLQYSAGSLDRQYRNTHSYRRSFSQGSKSVFTNSYKPLDNGSSGSDKDPITRECRKLEVSLRALSADCICYEQSVSQDGSVYRWSHCEGDGIIFDETNSKIDFSDQMTTQNKSLSSEKCAKISETVNERSLLIENAQGAKCNTLNEKFSYFRLKKSNLKSLDLGHFETQEDKVFYPVMSSHCDVPSEITNSSKSQSFNHRSDEKKHKLSLFEMLKMKFMKFLDDDYEIEENKIQNNIRKTFQKKSEKLELTDDSCSFSDQFSFENRAALSNNLCSFPNPFSFAVREFPLSSCPIFRQSSVLDMSDDCIGTKYFSQIDSSLKKTSLQCTSEENYPSPLSNLKSSFDAEERQNCKMTSVFQVNNQKLEPVSGIQNSGITGALETSAQSNMIGTSDWIEMNNHSHNNKRDATSDHTCNYSQKNLVQRQNLDPTFKVEIDSQRLLQPKFYINKEDMLIPNDTVSLEEDFHHSNSALGSINLASVESSPHDSFVIHSYQKDHCQILPATDVDMNWNGNRFSKNRSNGKNHSWVVYKEVEKSMNERSTEYNCQPHLQCQLDVKSCLSTASKSNSLSVDKKRSETEKTNSTTGSSQSVAKNKSINNESFHQVPEIDMKNVKMRANCHKETNTDISHLAKAGYLGSKTKSEYFSAWHPLAEELDVKYNPASNLQPNVKCTGESPYIKNSQHLKSPDICKNVESPSSSDMTRQELCRFYHVFKKGELEQLISGHIRDLITVHSMFDHSNWCVIAEKIQF